jgi:hypothetical protein
MRKFSQWLQTPKRPFDWYLLANLDFLVYLATYRLGLTRPWWEGVCWLSFISLAFFIAKVWTFLPVYIIIPAFLYFCWILYVLVDKGFEIQAKVDEIGMPMRGTMGLTPFGTFLRYMVISFCLLQLKTDSVRGAVEMLLLFFSLCLHCTHYWPRPAKTKREDEKRVSFQQLQMEYQT